MDWTDRWECTGHHMEFGFYSSCGGKPLIEFRQRCVPTGLMISKADDLVAVWVRSVRGTTVSIE